MSALLPSAERAQLAKRLALLGSDKPGERDAAGLAAHRFISQRGLTWLDVLNVTDSPVTWREMVATCLQRPDALTAWETQFLTSLTHFSSLSPKQRQRLDQITARMGTRP